MIGSWPIVQYVALEFMRIFPEVMPDSGKPPPPCTPKLSGKSCGKIRRPAQMLLKPMNPPIFRQMGHRSFSHLPLQEHRRTLKSKTVNPS